MWEKALWKEHTRTLLGRCQCLLKAKLSQRVKKRGLSLRDQEVQELAESQKSDSDNHILYLHSASPGISSTQLAPYTVITILLTVFPMLYLLSQDYFVATNLCFLVPHVFHPVSLLPSPLAATSSLSCVCESASILFVHFFFYLESTYK